MVTLSERELRKMPFIFQRCLLEDPRVQYAELGRNSGVSRVTAKKYLNQFLNEQILFPPQLRLRCGTQVAEYMYLLKVTNPFSFIPILKEQKWVFYYCTMVGDFNLSFLSYKPVDLSFCKGYINTIESGIRSKFLVPPIREKEYCTAFKRIHAKTQGRIEPSSIEMTLEDIEWTEELWNLYLDLKYNMSMDSTPIVKKYGFKYTTFYERVKWLLQNNDMYVPLYPLGEERYVYMYFLFKSDFPKLIIESFGELPVFSSHLRIKDSLLSLIPIPYGMEKDYFLNIFSLWEKKGIFDSYTMSMPYNSEIIHPGMPLPALAPPPIGVTIPKGGKENAERTHISFI